MDLLVVCAGLSKPRIVDLTIMKRNVLLLVVAIGAIGKLLFALSKEVK
jgi:hypothetical protein